MEPISLLMSKCLFKLIFLKLHYTEHTHIRVSIARLLILVVTVLRLGPP